VTLTQIKLPRQLEADGSAGQILALLNRRTEKLWAGGEQLAPVLPLNAALADALRAAKNYAHVRRGLESITAKLAEEQRGLAKSGARRPVEDAPRVSRLLLCSNDGAERFYRRVEWLWREHGPRLLIVRIEVEEAALGTLLFGEGALAKLIMLDHKDAVAEVLRSLLRADEEGGA